MNQLFIVISLIVFIVLVIKIIYKLKNNQKREAGTYSLCSLGNLLVMASLDTERMFKSLYLNVFKNNNVSIFVDTASGSEPNYILLFTGIAVFAFGIILEKKIHSKKDQYILNVQAYTDNKIEFFKSTKTNGLNNLKEEYVDLIPYWDNIKNEKSKSKTIKQNIKKLSEQIEKTALSFKDKTIECKCRCFTGIAPIPFLIYLGYNIPKLGFDNYYEIDKTNSNNNIEPLKDNEKKHYEKIKTDTKNFNNESSTDVLLAISTTAKISDSDMKQFEDMQITHIYIENPSHSAIISKYQINEYAKYIIQEIINIKNLKPDLKVIHLICSCKPSLVFRLGQLIDDTQMPIMIAYQYKQDDDVRYPWGIYINYKNKGNAYIWKNNMGVLNVQRK